jgi:hypothetical protein
MAKEIDIQIAIKALKKKRIKLLGAIEQLDESILNFENDLVTKTNKTDAEDNLESDDTKVEIDLLFANAVTAGDRIYVILKDILKRASTHSQIKEAFSTKFDDTVNVRKELYKLKANKMIVSLQLNNSVFHTYYGLPEWILTTDKGQEFKPPFAPDI